MFQYPDLGLEYRGNYYATANGMLTLVWWSTGPGGFDAEATCTLTGGSLTILYNEDMQLDGFDNSVYVLSP